GGWADIISLALQSYDPNAPPKSRGYPVERRMDPRVIAAQQAADAAAKAAADEKKALQAQIAALQGKPRVPNGLLLAGAAVIAVLVLRRRR
ncbi:MAG TPA: hypothetical protein VFH61_03625, partial [Thermoleophilia bacterium]|nr:hypothetical protein [Thermoleophilia bacterium]